MARELTEVVLVVGLNVCSASDGSGRAPLDGEAPRRRVPQARHARAPGAAAAVLAGAAPRAGGVRPPRPPRPALRGDGGRVVQAAPASALRARVPGAGARRALPAVSTRRGTGDGGGHRANLPRGPEGRLS